MSVVLVLLEDVALDPGSSSVSLGGGERYISLGLTSRALRFLELQSMERKQWYMY